MRSSGRYSSPYFAAWNACPMPTPSTNRPGWAWARVAPPFSAVRPGRAQTLAIPVPSTTSGTEASLEDIARRAGVGIGTLYRHFPTRDALLETLLRARFDGQAERARELLTHPEPLNALQTWLAGLGDATGTFRGLVELTADA